MTYWCRSVFINSETIYTSSNLLNDSGFIISTISIIYHTTNKQQATSNKQHQITNKRKEKQIDRKIDRWMDGYSSHTIDEKERQIDTNMSVCVWVCCCRCWLCWEYSYMTSLNVIEIMYRLYFILRRWLMNMLVRRRSEWVSEWVSK